MSLVAGAATGPVAADSAARASRPTHWTIGWLGSPRRRIWMLTGALLLAGSAVHGVALGALGSPRVALHAPLLLLVVAFAAAERFAVHLHVGKEAQSFSLSEIPLVVGLFLVEPATLVTARLLGSLVALLWCRLPAHKLAFNVAWLWLETAVVVTVWHAILGDRDPLGPVGWLAVIGAIVVVDLLGTAVISLAIRLHDGTAQRGVLRRAFASGVVSALVGASFGTAAVIVLLADWRAVWVLVVIAAALFLAHRTHGALQRRHTSLEQLNQFARVVGSEAHVDDVARAIVAQLRELLQAERAEVAITRGLGGVPTRLTCGPDGTISDHQSLDGGLVRALAAVPAADALLLRRHGRDAERRRRLGGVKDGMVAPLHGDDGVIGAVAVADRSGDVDSFSRADLAVLEALASHASLALHNAQSTWLALTREHEATHDPLTDLPNRRFLDRDLAVAIEEAVRQNSHVALVLLDLDGFKEINDDFGHRAGDLVLRTVANRLRKAARADDLVARVGGDEFAILLRGVPDRAAVEALVKRLSGVVAEPCTIEGLPVTVGGSFGIAFYPEHGLDADTLTQRADAAMYSVKELGGGVAVYGSGAPGIGSGQSMVGRITLLRDLDQAIRERRLELHYQPQIDMRTQKAVAVEALLRWRHPDLGFVPPGEFVPLAELGDLIRPLTELVLEAALQQCARWHRQGLRIGVAVNLSPGNLSDAALPAMVAGLLNAVGLSPSWLELEITENGIITQPAISSGVLAAFRDMGVRLSIDDFGTGQSSLGRLRDLPVNTVKIDRSFIARLHSSHGDGVIARSIIDLAHGLNLQVVAEGIEDATTYEGLERLGCDVAQGYFIGPPMPPEQLYAWLRRPELSVVGQPAALERADVRPA